MRHLEVTHVYVLPVDADDVGVIDAIAARGVQIMEDHLNEFASRIQDLHSDWKLMPKEYSAAHGSDEEERIPARVPARYDQDPNLSQSDKDRDSILSKQIIEGDLDGGISFAGDVMGQGSARATHPWDQGLSIFPEDHPLRPFEDKLRKEQETEALEQMQALAPKLKELPSGE